MVISFDDLNKMKSVKMFNAEYIKDNKFTGVSIDSRKSKANDLFIAIKGSNYDGHDYVKDSFRKGIKTAIVDKHWFYKYRHESFLKNKTILTTSDTISAMGELANIYRRKFIIPIIGVAGSNGKTTTKDFISNVLSQRYHILKSDKSFNNQIGVPLTLFRLNKNHDICVLELGTNHFGEVSNLCKIAEPQFGLITNLGKEHLQFFKSITGVFKAETELTDYLRKCYGVFFLNKDDKVLLSNLKTDSLNIFSYGKTSSNVTGKILGYEGFYPVIQIKYEDIIIKTKLNLIGTQSFYSALSASAVGFYFKVPRINILDSLKKFRIKTHSRFELIRASGFYIIDDTYNSNPDSVKEALLNLKQFKISGKKHIVFADMNELGKSSMREHFKVGKMIKELGFENLTTFGKCAYDIFRGAKGIKNNFYFSDKVTLSEYLKFRIKKNDIVLVKGSRSMKMESVVESLKEFKIKN